MFSLLSNNISKSIGIIRNKGVITEKDFDAFVKSLRMNLLEADVSLSVTKSLIASLRENVIGQKSLQYVSEQSAGIVKIVKEEFINILGGTQSKLDVEGDGLKSILMVGLQGVGKTTSTAKLAVFIEKKYKKKVLLSSFDIYRPAAREQLRILAEQVSIDTVPIIDGDTISSILDRTKKMSSEYDVLICDTAGRLHVDEHMMQELILIKDQIAPSEVIQVVDCMMGQDSFNVVNSFKEKLSTTGIIVSRVDSDARGGAILSVRHSTGIPVKFSGVGEKVADFEEFHPDRMASRILDMGDLESLVEFASSHIEKEKMDSLKDKIEGGKFTYEDLVAQFRTIEKLGGMMKLLKFIPGINKIPMEQVADESVFKRNLAMINSMTKREKKCLDPLTHSRKQRICKGSGVKISDMNKLMKNFENAKSIAARMSKKGFGSSNMDNIADLLKK